MSADWDPDTFLSLVGSVFILEVAVAGEPGPITMPLTLAEVTEHAGFPGAPRQRPFTLIFTGPQRLPQGVYALRHEAGEVFEIFVVPLQPRPDGTGIYEAVFN